MKRDINKEVPKSFWNSSGQGFRNMRSSCFVRLDQPILGSFHMAQSLSEVSLGRNKLFCKRILVSSLFVAALKPFISLDKNLQILNSEQVTLSTRIERNANYRSSAHCSAILVLCSDA